MSLHENVQCHANLAATHYTSNNSKVDKMATIGTIMMITLMVIMLAIIRTILNGNTPIGDNKDKENNQTGKNE